MECQGSCEGDSTLNHLGRVVEHNRDEVSNASGRKLPKHHVFISMPWLASSSNPDPVSEYPVPVMVNQHHSDLRQEWEPLPPGTWVVVSQVDKSPLTPLGLVVTAFGAVDESLLEDRRSESAYSIHSEGNIDKVVTQPENEDSEPNEDYGRTHKDGSGNGWESRRPNSADPNRNYSRFFLGDSHYLRLEDRLDETKTMIELMNLVMQGYIRIESTNNPERWEIVLNDGDGQEIKIARLPQPRIEITSLPTPAMPNGAKVVIDPQQPSIRLETLPVPLSVHLGNNQVIAQASGVLTSSLPRWENGGLSDYFDLLLAALEAQLSARLVGITPGMQQPIMVPASLPRPLPTIPTTVLKGE